MSKIIALFMSIIMFFIPTANYPEAQKAENTPTDYSFVFVHGLSGWGSYDLAYKIMPYWGMFGGDLMQYLNARGFDCYSASVSGADSAWDRACELYAQLTGTKTDYGAEHSERCKHPRYGKDFTGKALVPEFDSEHKINLLGHSFGGTTVRLFAELMANGSETEREYTDSADISPLFTGGKADMIYSVTTLAAPHNGTTAYDAQAAIEADKNSTLRERATVKMFLLASLKKNDGRIDEDTVTYDLHVDGAAELNEKISTVDSIYYFSYACYASKQQEDGTYKAEDDIMEFIFVPAANRMGSLTGVSDKGIVKDESWQLNDGIVNTRSALHPDNAPYTDFDNNNINPGIWNVMPLYHGDHMSLQGGMTKNNNVRLFYVDLLNMINSIK